MYTRRNDKDRHYLRHCPENPNRIIVCKHCVNDGKDGDVPGAEPGLMCHLAEVHNQQGEYLCSHCQTVFFGTKTGKAQSKVHEEKPCYVNIRSRESKLLLISCVFCMTL